LPPLLVLGKYSYAMYILNKPMSCLAQWCFPTSEWMLFGSQLPAFLVNCLLGMGFTLAGALVTWHLLEKPCLSLKRFFETSAPAPATQPRQPARKAAA